MSTVLEGARIVLRDVRRTASAWRDARGLADLLYTRWYHVTSDVYRQYPDLGAYRAAYALGAGLVPGWRVVAPRPDAAPGAIIAEADGEQRLVYPTDYAPADATRLGVAPGDAILLTTRIDDVSGGFWHVWSPAWRVTPPEQLVRVYFRVATGHETAFVARVSAHAPRGETWSLKVLAGTHSAGRADAAVLYLDRNHGIRAGWVTSLVTAVAPLLEDGAPPLTALITAGVAWADDPGGGVSFGEHRCRVLAAAAHAQPAALDSARSWRRAAAESFAREGLDLARPHLQGREGRRAAEGA